jgi:hypothetical protein
MKDLCLFRHSLQWVNMIMLIRIPFGKDLMIS